MLTVHSYERSGVPVVAVAGDLDLGSVPQLRAVLHELGSGNHGRVVVDLSGVDVLDSTGLGVVLGVVRRVRDRGGEVQIVITEPRVRRVFEVLGLDRSLPLVPDLDAALAAASAPVVADG